MVSKEGRSTMFKGVCRGSVYINTHTEHLAVHAWYAFFSKKVHPWNGHVRHRMRKCRSRTEELSDSLSDHVTI